MNKMKTLQLTNMEIFYLKDFVGREWQKYIDTIVDKNNMSDLDKEIYKHLLELHDKLHKLHLDKD